MGRKYNASRFETLDFHPLNDAIDECLVISNEDNQIVPDELLDMRGGEKGNTSLGYLNKKCDKSEGITEHKKLKALKAKNIENYRKQLEENGEFEYNVNEEKLARNELCFAKLMIDSGMITLDDEDE